MDYEQPLEALLAKSLLYQTLDLSMQNIRQYCTNKFELRLGGLKDARDTEL